MKRKTTILLLLICILISSSYSSSAFSVKKITTTNLSTSYRAVIIGISDYPGTSKDLITPVKNALAIENCLERNSKSYNIKRLTDSDATLNNIRNKLDWLKNNADDDDVSIFYYCGHGTQRDTVDYKREGDTNDECLSLYDGVMHDDELIDRILEIKGYVFVILDCCKSAGFEHDLDYKITGPLVSQSKIFLLTAFGENQNLFEHKLLGYSLLTFHLIGGFSTDPNHDEKITIDEIYSIAREIFESGKKALGVGYEGGINIYPPKGHSRYYEFSYKAIINGFSNQPPWIEEFKIPDESQQKCEIELKLRDDNDDKIHVFVNWDDGSGGWEGPYHNYETIKMSHNYQENKKYRISIVLKDSKGAVSKWITKEVSIKKNRAFASHDVFDFILSKILNYNLSKLFYQIQNFKLYKG